MQPTRLEDHLVRELTLAKAEGVLQVGLKHGSFRVFRDDSQNLLINGLLISLALFRGFVFLFLGLKDVSILLGSLFAGVGLDSSEIFVINLIIYLHGRDVQLGGGGQQVTLVDPTKRATVQLERA